MLILHRTHVTFETKSKYEPDLYNKFITIFGVLPLKLNQVSECFVMFISNLITSHAVHFARAERACYPCSTRQISVNLTK